jgi:hypothetical protein
MILTVGGDAASKGAQEVMQALAIIDTKHPIGNMFAKYGLSREPRTSKPGRSGNGNTPGH